MARRVAFFDSPAAQLHITGNFTLVDDEQFIGGKLLLEAEQMLFIALRDRSSILCYKNAPLPTPAPPKAAFAVVARDVR